jgi:hypothetical protein
MVTKKKVGKSNKGYFWKKIKKTIKFEANEDKTPLNLSKIFKKN